MRQALSEAGQGQGQGQAWDRDGPGPAAPPALLRPLRAGAAPPECLRLTDGS